MPGARDNEHAHLDGDTKSHDSSRVKAEATVLIGADGSTAVRFRALARLCDATGDIAHGSSRIAGGVFDMLADLGDMEQAEPGQRADRFIAQLEKVSAEITSLEMPLTEVVTGLHDLKKMVREAGKIGGDDAEVLTLAEQFFAVEDKWLEKQKEVGHELTTELIVLGEERRRLARAIAAIRSRTCVGAQTKARILAAFMDLGGDGMPMPRDERDALIWSIGLDLSTEAPKRQAAKGGGRADGSVQEDADIGRPGFA